MKKLNRTNTTKTAINTSINVYKAWTGTYLNLPSTSQLLVCNLAPRPTKPTCMLPAPSARWQNLQLWQLVRDKFAVLPFPQQGASFAPSQQQVDFKIILDQWLSATSVKVSARSKHVQLAHLLCQKLLRTCLKKKQSIKHKQRVLYSRLLLTRTHTDLDIRAGEAQPLWDN